MNSGHFSIVIATLAMVAMKDRVVPISNLHRKNPTRPS
jgi:hypothetical protein